jgi:hypothetical protein
VPQTVSRVVSPFSRQQPATFFQNAINPAIQLTRHLGCRPVLMDRPLCHHAQFLDDAFPLPKALSVMGITQTFITYHNVRKVVMYLIK